MTGPCPRPECGGESHTDGWGKPIQCPAAQARPLRLTTEELVPVLVALERRQRGQMAGHGILRYPLPACPSCGAPPTEMTTVPSPDFLTDTVAIQFERCGHAFTANGEDAAEAARIARQQAESPLPDDGTGPEEPPAVTPLEEAQATIESLRYQIRRAREALATDEPVRRCSSCEHRWDIHSDDGCWHTVGQGRPGRNLVCACRVPRKEKP